MTFSKVKVLTAKEWYSRWGGWSALDLILGGEQWLGTEITKRFFHLQGVAPRCILLILYIYIAWKTLLIHKRN